MLLPNSYLISTFSFDLRLTVANLWYAFPSFSWIYSAHGHMASVYIGKRALCDDAGASSNTMLWQKAEVIICSTACKLENDESLVEEKHVIRAISRRIRHVAFVVICFTRQMPVDCSCL